MKEVAEVVEARLKWTFANVNRCEREVERHEGIVLFQYRRSELIVVLRP